uniref:Ciliary neurotrophic factor n=1 Tax=Salvator merianae TaxID=96440 RepID=A0A8D0DMH1_SALMN
MKQRSTDLLSTYLRYQGSPFSDPGFSILTLEYENVPMAAITYQEWRALTNVQRLEKNYEAYATFSEFFQVVRDDQLDINPNEKELLDMLTKTQLHIQGLLNNLTSIMSALGAPPPTAKDLLTLDITKAGFFEKKIRGYVVCQRYTEWLVRTEQDLTFLHSNFPNLRFVDK